MENLFSEFESSLARQRPVASSVTSSSVMFEAGFVEGTRRQAAKQQNTTRWWQLATACSLLLTTGIVLSNIQKQSDESTIANRVDRVDQSETKERAESNGIKPEFPSEANSFRDEKMQVLQRPGFAESPLARLFARPVTDSKVSSRMATRKEVLLRGVAGLPEPLVISTNRNESSGSKTGLLKELLLERPGSGSIIRARNFFSFPNQSGLQ